jgi:hypothetical protein
MAKCEHQPVEQTRGEMGPGDYFDVIENRRIILALPEEVIDNIHNWVDLDDTNRTDFRIICRKCHLTTGWMKADAPGYPGVLRDSNRKLWDEIKQYTVEEWGAVQRSKGVRPRISPLLSGSGTK